MDALSSGVNALLRGAISSLPAGTSHEPLAIHAGRIAASSCADAFTVDLRDHIVFPGLINAHDHLHINCVPPLAADGPFASSYAWIEAFQAHFQNPAVIAALRVPKALRLRHGALKNLLAGVTCVAHHDPWHAALDAPDFPVDLLRDFGWSYTLNGPDYGPAVGESFTATPTNRPWLIHLAEGTDAIAQRELEQLEKLGCLAENSVLIHGVGLRECDIDRVIPSGAAVVWCPSSNLNLLGRTLNPNRLAAAGRLALGSDSRLSGARDLCEEMYIATECFDLSPQQIVDLVTTCAADILRLPAYGHLVPGAAANLVIVEDHGGDTAANLVGLERRQIRAVVRNGKPQIADPDFADWFESAGVEFVSTILDGQPKLLAHGLADPALIALEPGLELAVTEIDRATRSEAYC
jgi:cytosine/adenosine deaminase-related metal-dependent hydrolase